MIIIFLVILTLRLLSPEKINITLNGGENVKLNQAIPLNHVILKYINLNDYVWLEKTDGTRFIYDKDNSVLDCEEYDGKIYCFDGLVLNGKNIEYLSYVERMNLIKEANINDIIVKEHRRIESIEKLIDFVNANEISPFTKQKIDGIIIQENNKPYKVAKIYKLKRDIMNTIDFLVKYQKESSSKENAIFYLYSSGKYVNNDSIQIKYPNINDCSLFVSPYTNNSHIFSLSEIDKDNLIKKNYPKYIIDEIINISKEIIKNPESFDGKIIELSFDGEKYYPIRIREDKVFPNGYRTAISNIGLVYAPLSLKGQYFEKTTNEIFSKDVIDKFHENSHNIRKEIFSKISWLNKTKNKLSCLDLSSGRGGDLLNLLNANYKNLFCVDIDKIALTQLVNKLYQTDYYKNTWLNVFDYDLSKDLHELYENIINRNNYKKEKCFNLIFMNFAIHYIIDNVSNLNEFVHKLLLKNGHFIFTFFDGDRIIKEENKSKEPLSVKSYQKDGKWYGKFPLPTIDASGYREERLVLRKDLEVFGENYIEYKNIIDDKYFGLICLRIYMIG